MCDTRTLVGPNSQVNEGCDIPSPLSRLYIPPSLPARLLIRCLAGAQMLFKQTLSENRQKEHGPYKLYAQHE